MSFKFRGVLCRIRLFPALISKIKWLWSDLSPTVGNSKSSPKTKSEKESQDLRNKQCDQTTATIKLLTVLPDRISRIIDHQDGLFAHASMCYLLGQHLTSKLGLDSPASAILAVIPILNSKINLLDSSKRDLILILNKILASSDLTQDKAVDALRALAMIRNVFVEVLWW